MGKKKFPKGQKTEPSDGSQEPPRASTSTADPVTQRGPDPNKKQPAPSSEMQQMSLQTPKTDSSAQGKGRGKGRGKPQESLHSPGSQQSPRHGISENPQQYVPQGAPPPQALPPTFIQQRPQQGPPPVTYPTGPAEYFQQQTRPGMPGPQVRFPRAPFPQSIQPLMSQQVGPPPSIQPLMSQQVGPPPQFYQQTTPQTMAGPAPHQQFRSPTHSYPHGPPPRMPQQAAPPGQLHQQSLPPGVFQQQPLQQGGTAHQTPRQQPTQLNAPKEHMISEKTEAEPNLPSQRRGRQKKGEKQQPPPKMPQQVEPPGQLHQQSPPPGVLQQQHLPQGGTAQQTPRQQPTQLDAPKERMKSEKTEAEPNLPSQQRGRQKKGEKQEKKEQAPIKQASSEQQTSKNAATKGQPGKGDQAKPRKETSPTDLIVPLRKQLNLGGTKGRTIMIETNHLALALKNLKPAIHYDVTIDPDKPKKLLRVVMEQFRRDKFPNRYPAFDGTRNLFSSSQLPFGDEISGEVKVQEDDRERTYTVKIKYATEVDLTCLLRYFESAARGNTHMVTPQEAIQCIDVVLRNAPSLHCIPVGRSFFTKPQQPQHYDLGEGMLMYHGFYQSAVLGWKPYLNVDVSHKAFPKEIHVLDLIQELTGGYYRITEPLIRQNFEVVDKFMRSLKVLYQIPNQPNSKRVMRVNQLDKSASDYTFTNENNVKMTVATYFERIKGTRLKYPHLPCLWVGSRQREPRILLPMEFCTIMDGQVTNRTMTPNQTSAMIKMAATSTSVRKDKIMTSVRQANYNSDRCAQEFGISVNTEFTKIKARVLPPPSIRYIDGQVTVNKGVWRSKKFCSPGVLDNWAIVCLNDRTRPQELQEFANMMIQEGRPVGMNIGNPTIEPPIRLQRGREKQQIEAEFQKLKSCKLILVVISEIKEIYNYVKQAAELSVGVITQCVKGKNLFRPKQSTVGNILLKVNAKLNGLNHTLATNPACLSVPCMIMGADVTHPSPESRGTTPSVAAVTASHDRHAFKYNITCRLQQSTQEIITDLANIAHEHLTYFEQQNKIKPARIIFFRDGVSEGQFETVVNSEVQAVRRACQMIDPTGAYRPKLTFLVVQKRHHTRFFPTNPRDSEDRNNNVPAGTVVDTEITHPTALDFYLVSHASIQGVARPTKYRKLWDENDMQEDELEELTYHLCHMFARCTRSVSYPAPTYYAHLAAARAKVYCERQNINMNNLEREQKSYLTIKSEVVKGTPMYFV